MTAQRKGPGQPPRPLHPGRKVRHFDDLGVWLLITTMLLLTAMALATVLLEALGVDLGVPVEATP